MTIYLFHGDDTTASRNNLYVEKKKHQEIREINGEKVIPSDLESTLGTKSLFGMETLLIENIFSRLRSKDRESCIDLLKNYTGNSDILLWEKKALTKLTTSKLPKNWVIKESKPPSLLFNFLDSVTPRNYQQAITLLKALRKASEDGLIFIMLSRHIASLIQAKSATVLKLPPWQIGKFKSQAAAWDEVSLVQFYDQLYQIDRKIKTGSTKLDLGSQLDILLLQVLG